MNSISTRLLDLLQRLVLPRRLALLQVFALSTIIGIFLATPVVAQSVQVLGDFRDWSSFTATDSSGRLCFSMSEPTQTEPTPDGYGEAHVYLTHRVAEGIRNEFNLISGYEFAPDSIATATVGGRAYPLYTQLDAAWLEDPAQGDNFAGNLRAGSSLQIEGTSLLGVKIVQTFSLSGVTASSRAADRAC